MTTTMTTNNAPDLSEKGGARDGKPQTLDRRLFFQLTAFGGVRDAQALAKDLAEAKVEAVLYADINDPRGVAVLAMSEDPGFFTGDLRKLFNSPPFDKLTPKPELSMLGRTYALGYEPNLEDWLLKRPRQTALSSEWPWAVWYPLRRTGAFSQLPREEQGKILREHGIIGRSFGEADLAHDVRLNCNGLDANDNDFVIGLVGKDLFPLSALVARMRSTVQTSTYIQNMGPFFVGKAIWKSEAPQ